MAEALEDHGHCYKHPHKNIVIGGFFELTELLEFSFRTQIYFFIVRLKIP